MISELVQGHYIFPRGTLKVKFEFNLDPWFTKLVQGQWILSNLLHPNWVNRGVKLQTQIFIRSFFFCTLTSDLENLFKVIAHCLPMDTSLIKIESDLATRERKYMLQRNGIFVNSEVSSPWNQPTIVSSVFAVLAAVLPTKVLVSIFFTLSPPEPRSVEIL